MKNRIWSGVGILSILFIVGIETGTALNYFDEPNNISSDAGVGTFNQRCSELFLDFFTEYYSILLSASDGPRGFDNTDYVLRANDSSKNDSSKIDSSKIESDAKEFISELLLSFEPPLASIVLQYLDSRKNDSSLPQKEQNLSSTVREAVAKLLTDPARMNASHDTNPFVLTSKRTFDQILRTKRETHLVWEYVLDALEDAVMDLRRATDTQLNKELFQILGQPLTRQTRNPHNTSAALEAFDPTVDAIVKQILSGSDSLPDRLKQLLSNKGFDARTSLADTMRIFVQVFQSLANKRWFEAQGQEANRFHVEKLLERFLPSSTLRLASSTPRKFELIEETSASQVQNRVSKNRTGTAGELNLNTIWDDLLKLSNDSKVLVRKKRVETPPQNVSAKAADSKAPVNVSSVQGKDPAGAANKLTSQSSSTNAANPIADKSVSAGQRVTEDTTKNITKRQVQIVPPTIYKPVPIISSVNVAASKTGSNVTTSDTDKLHTGQNQGKTNATLPVSSSSAAQQTHPEVQGKSGVNPMSSGVTSTPPQGTTHVLAQGPNTLLATNQAAQLPAEPKANPGVVDPSHVFPGTIPTELIKPVPFTMISGSAQPSTGLPGTNIQASPVFSQSVVGASGNPENPVNLAANPAMPMNAAANPAIPVNAATNPAFPVNAAANPVIPVNAAVNPAIPVNAANNPASPVNAATNPALPVNAAANPAIPLNAAANPVIPVNAAASPSIPVNAAANPAVPVNLAAIPALQMNTPVNPAIPMNAAHNPAISTNSGTNPAISTNSGTNPASPVIAPIAPNTPLQVSNLGAPFAIPQGPPIATNPQTGLNDPARSPAVLTTQNDPKTPVTAMLPAVNDPVKTPVFQSVQSEAVKPPSAPVAPFTVGDPAKPLSAEGAVNPVPVGVIPAVNPPSASSQPGTPLVGEKEKTIAVLNASIQPVSILGSSIEPVKLVNVPTLSSGSSDPQKPIYGVMNFSSVNPSSLALNGSGMSPQNPSSIVGNVGNLGGKNESNLSGSGSGISTSIPFIIGNVSGANFSAASPVALTNLTGFMKEMAANQGQATEQVTERSKLSDAHILGQSSFFKSDPVKFASDIQKGSIQQWAGLVVILVVLGLIVIGSVLFWKFSSETGVAGNENTTTRENPASMNNYCYLAGNSCARTSIRGPTDRGDSDEERNERSQLIELSQFRKSEVPA